MPIRTIFTFIIFLFSNALFAQAESDYIRMLADHFGGAREHSVPNGRVDILTDQYAIEVEFATKWKNSISQALWYSLNTDRQAGIILLLKSNEENRFAVMLESTLQHAGIDQVQVWVYPTDFPGLDVNRVFQRYQQEKIDQAGPETNYWLTSNSNKRHQRGCRNFEHTNGRYCQAREGEAAGCCH